MRTGDQPAGPAATAPYRFAEQHTPPPAVRASEVAQTTFEHVYEVDPRLMQEHVLQQVFPNWDTLRIMRSRHDHLAWMHRHFAHTVVTGSELLAEVEAETAGPGNPQAPTPGPGPISGPVAP
ncbi:hypothetical protein SAMN05660359_04176 [Geodermatophilus obscurus]|jgi:hypothetical protein|uniref:Uncharacterized protein n=1 Tax=Geodermatophilus obscurus TaxID=1861 RepID=A0A1I5HZQ0_9ACTN|nr:hypothetical protein [Geodermatophilus obscurus]SFO53812.1 hypothetical protein SAMN05660359_04176 [Geodermatophilus obscurus]